MNKKNKKKQEDSINTVTIQADESPRLNIPELWASRELFFFLAWRDIKVRYKQTFLGVGWAILQPAITAAIFTIFFNRVAKIDTGSVNIPYPVFAYLGLTYWGAFASAMTNVSNSIVGNIGVIGKVYFPRLIPPLSAVAVAVIDFCFAMVVFVLLVFVFGVKINPLGLLWIFPSLLFITFAAMGLFFASLNVKYRDVRSALPFIVQIMFFTTPVIYPITMIPQKYQLLAYLNPATGAISSIKAFLFNQPVEWLGCGISLLCSVIIFIIGLWAFKRTERHFSDYL